ncbi:MAG: hypothetical protein JWM47_3575, partial [Acidimicrobiales bacterium]|nr:hypothetical protein [Acidimicrobiales bacterium]
MCGIIAVLRRRSDRTPPAAEEVLVLFAGGADALLATEPPLLAPVVADVAERVEQVDRL